MDTNILTLPVPAEPLPPLTVVRVVPYNVVSSAPVPQKKSGVSGAWHDVAVSSDVGLWSGQTRHHVPVAEDYLGQLSCGEEGSRKTAPYSLLIEAGRLVTSVSILHFSVCVFRYIIQTLPVSVE